MYIDNFGNFIAERSSDFRGWEFIGKEKYKKDVWKIYIRLMTMEKKYFRIVFCDKKNLPEVKKGMCV